MFSKILLSSRSEINREIGRCQSRIGGPTMDKVSISLQDIIEGQQGSLMATYLAISYVASHIASREDDNGLTKV